jgi:hypothetical protein
MSPTTAWRTSSLLLSAPDFEDFLPFPLLPLCDMFTCRGQSVASERYLGEYCEVKLKRTRTVGLGQISSDSINGTSPPHLGVGALTLVNWLSCSAEVIIQTLHCQSTLSPVDLQRPAVEIILPDAER